MIRCTDTDAAVSRTPLPGNYSDTDLLCSSPPPERPDKDVTAASLARVSGRYHALLTLQFGSQFGTVVSKYAGSVGNGMSLSMPLSAFDGQIRKRGASLTGICMICSAESHGVLKGSIAARTAK